MPIYLDRSAHPKSSLRRVVCALVLAAVVGTPSTAPAQDAAPDTLTPGRVGHMTLRELLDEEVVYAAARYDQKPAEAASSITLITAQEIRQFGYRTMQDVLSAVRGFYTTYDRNYSYLGIRGISPTGDYNSRVLVLLDGHRINENTYDSVYIGTESLIDMNLVDRVEVVHGPGSSLFGSNAVFAVVNFVTRAAGAKPSLQVEGDLGSFGTRAGRASYSARTASGIDVLIAGSRYASDGQRALFFEEFAGQPSGGVTRATDGDAYQRLFARASRGAWTAEGAWAGREKHIPTGAYNTVFTDPRTMTSDRRGFASLAYKGPERGPAAIAWRLAIDHYAYDGHYVLDYGDASAPDVLVNQDRARGTWLTSELQAVRRLGTRHHLLGGLEVRANDQAIGNFDRAVYSDLHARTAVLGLFAQDEWKLLPRLAMVIGVRHDRYPSFGGTTNPRFSAVITVTPATLVKLTYGRAFRPPNLAERSDELDLLHGTGPRDAVQPERMIASEAIVEHHRDHLLGGDAWFSASGYDNDLHDLIDNYVVDGWTRTRNFGTARARGVEFEGRLHWRNGMAARGSYSLNHSTDGDGARLVNAPRQLGSLRLQLPLAGERLGLGLQELFIGSRLSTDRTVVDRTLRTDATLQWQAAGRLTLSANVRDLFNRANYEPTSGALVQSRLRTDGRTLYITTGWRF